MRLLPLFLGLLLITGAAMGASAPLNKDVNTPIKSDTGTANRLGWVAIQTIAAAETSDDDQLLNYTGGALNQTTNLIVTSTGAYSAYFLAQPDVPRNIIVTTNASTSGSIKLTGTDIASAAITENITLSSASSGASTKAFKTVTQIDADLTTGQTAKTLKVGTGDLLGLNSKLTKNTVLFDFVGATRDTTAPSVTVNSTVLSLNTIDTYTAPGGSATMIWYIV